MDTLIHTDTHLLRLKSIQKLKKKLEKYTETVIIIIVMMIRTRKREAAKLYNV